MDIQNHPFLTLSHSIGPICSPLFQYGIKLFSFRRTFSDSKRINFTTDVNWLYDYYHFDLYQSSLFEADINSYQNGFSLWPHESDLPIFQHSRKYYRSGNGITLSIPTPTYCDFFIFGADIENVSIINFYINNLNLLTKFSTYFLKEGDSIIKKAMPHLIEVKAHHSNADHAKYVYSPIFKSENFIFKTIQDEYKFSEQQMICLVGMLENKSAKQMANMMGLSYRTVEEYNHIIKQKTKCKNRVEVIKKFHGLI